MLFRHTAAIGTKRGSVVAFVHFIFALTLLLFVTLGTPSVKAQENWHPGNSTTLSFSDPVAACANEFDTVYSGWNYNYTGMTYLNRNYVNCNWTKNFVNVFFPPYLTSQANLDCPSGTAPGAWNPSGCARPGQNGAPSCPVAAAPILKGDPINVLSGNVFEEVKDFSTNGPYPLALTRFYNSQWNDTSRMGAGWRTNFDREFSNSGTSVRIVLGDGKEALFEGWQGGWLPAYQDTSGNVQAPRTDVSWSLVQNANGWVFTDEDGTIENYSNSYQLTSIVYRGGYTQTLAYDGNGNNITVTDSLGRTITFSYSSGLMTSATAPDGQVYQYQYVSKYQYNGPALPSGTAPSPPPLTATVLTTVIYPATPPATNPQLSYEYENATYITALTGVTDERGIRYTTWTYDANGNATSSVNGGGVDQTSIAYDTVGNTRTVTNALGQQAIYQLTPGQGSQWRVASIQGQATTHCSAANSTYSYDNNGFVSQTIDGEGRVTSKINDNLGNPLSLTEGGGTAQARTTTISWLSSYPLPTQIVKPGLTVNLAYDSAGHLTQRQEIDTSGQPATSTGGQTRTRTYFYNSAGLLSSVGGSYGTSSYGYDSSGYVSSVTNALGQVTQIPTVNGMGQPLSSIDPNGAEADFAYDARGRVTQITVNPGAGAQITAIGYDAAGDVTSIARPTGVSYSYQYDAARRLSSITDASGAQIQYVRNVMGGIITTKVRDPNGNIVQTASATFDELNRLLARIGAAGQVTSYGYDRTDNQTSRTDPLGNQYSYAFDALNRVISESGPLQYNVSYGYDTQDHLTSVTDPRGLITSYVYDGFGDVISQTSPDTGTTTKTYDSAGNLSSSTDANGLTTHYSFDALKRLVLVTRADGTTSSYIWDQTDATHGNGIGHLTHAQDTESGTTLDWQYDAYGHVLQKTESIAGTTYTTAYTYNASTGNLQSMTLPSGAVVGYSWVFGRISALTLNNEPLVSNIGYQPFNGPNTWTLADQEATGRSYDLDGRIVSDPLGSITYDNGSRITQWSPGNQSVFSGQSIFGGGRSYGYDQLNRLTTYVDPSNNIAYSYDASGNRISQTVNSVQTNYSIDPYSNRLLGVSSSPSTTQTTTAAYGYDALGERATRTNSTDTRYFAYDEQKHLIGEYSPTAGAIQETVYLGDMPVAIVSGGNTYYVHADYRNAPRQVDNATGQAVWDWDPMAFGDNAENDNPLGLSTDFDYAPRFPGQYFDSESGMNYNMARYYQPANGRYGQSDPIGLRGGINTYSYVVGNPLSYVDPLGLVLGDLPPPIPGAENWPFNKFPDGTPYYTDPDGNKYTPHAEDTGHWRHWDKKCPDGKEVRVPKNTLKRFPTQKRPPYGDQSASDPNGDAEPWKEPEPALPQLPIPDELPIWMLPIIDPCLFMDCSLYQSPQA